MKPYPSDQLCPKCQKFLANLFKYAEDEEEIQEKALPKEFETKTAMVSSKLKGKVRVKKAKPKITLEDDKIQLQKGEYIKLLGITSENRTTLFCNNSKYIYLLELANNLNFISSSILGGVLDKMLLFSRENEKEKCQFYIKDNIIYLIYGAFPDKKGKWVLEQMAKHFTDLTRGKDVDQLEKIDKYQIETKFTGIIKFILEDYLKMQEIFSDQEIPYIDDKIRIDYIGLSSKSIGVISLLLGPELNVELPGVFDNPAEAKEMKESILTAKIEALAANTLGNTGSVPRWIAVKLGFQDYRFLTFKSYENDYFLYFLSEGNLEKIKKVEKELEPYISHVTTSTFSGNLQPFNRLKLSLKDIFKKTRIFG